MYIIIHFRFYYKKTDDNKSITILYRYINKEYLTAKRINLPYAVKYKKTC